METQSVSLVFGKNHRRFVRVQLWLTIGVIWATTGSLAAASANYTQQVVRSHLFQEPLAWVGTKAPPETQSRELLTDIRIFKSKGTPAGFAALEHFLTEHPRSPWAPALEVNMAAYYRHQGNYIGALSHWQAAWDTTKSSRDAVGEKIAVQTFAGWTRLLSSLGRRKQLSALFKELDSLHLPLGHYADKIQNTRAALEVMDARPSISYRCGSCALGHLAMALHLKPQIIQKFFQADSPSSGFTITELLALAKTNGLAVEAVRRPPGAKLVVPCVVHWKLNHYAAVVKRRNSQFLVQDPTFYGGDVWMDAKTLEAQSSGDFIMPKDKVPASWKPLGQVACAKIYGRGLNAIWDDNNDGGPSGCGGSGADSHKGSSCNPPASNDGAGGGGGVPSPSCGCGSSGAGGPKGMPRWYVSQPYITLWLTDAPLLYHQSSGQAMRLELSYKSRGQAQDTGIGGFGDDWSCNWQGMVQQPVGSSGAILNFLPIDNVVRLVNTNGQPTYKGGARVVRVKPPGDVVAQAGYRLALQWPNGGESQYGYTNTDFAGDTNYLLDYRVDRYGRILRRFNYVSTDGVAQLTSVLDMDGRTNTLTYGDPNHPWLITAVTDPYGRTAHFYYDFSQSPDGLLTNIVDAQGMSNYFQYDNSEEITNMITPYGTNSFQYFNGTDNNGYLARSLRITEPNGYHQLYAYRDYYSYQDSIITEDSKRHYRMSFHWNPKQYESISPQGKTSILDMTENDYHIASIKHWLHADETLQTMFVSDSMDSEAGAYDSSGARPGDTGFTYQGQAGMYISDGSTDALQRVTKIDLYDDNAGMVITRNTLGRPTSYTYETANPNVETMYTNVFDSSGTILQYELGPNDELTRGYGYDPVITNLLTSVTNAVGDVLRYTHAPSTLKVTSITFPSGMVRTNIYYASGPEQGFLEMQADLGIRTNWFGWQDGNLAAQTNELGLVTTYTYDNLNRLTSVTYPDGTTTSNIYDKLDLVATKDRLNQWTYYSYNSIRQLTAVTNVDDQVTTYGYCSCGAPDEIIHWNGSVPLTTLYNYDNNGRVTNVIYPDGYQLNYTYDTENRPVTITDDGGNGVGLSWYAYGLQSLLQSAYSYGYLLQRQFDEYGRVISSTDRNDVMTTNGYDFLGRLIARQSFGLFGSQSGLESFTYNSRGLTNYTDALGHVTTFVRDLAGRVQAETNANNEVLQFTYNPANELLSLTDGKGQTTSWNYDEYGRVTNKMDAAGNVDFVYQYDADNRLTNRWTPAKGTTVYRYDPLGNLTNVDYSGGTVYTPSIDYAYDGLNRLTNMLDELGDTTFTWTPGNQLASENGPWPDDAVSYTYDPGSRLRIGLSIDAPNADPWTQSYAYDLVMRLTNVVSPAGTFTYTYDSIDYCQPAEPDSLDIPNTQNSSGDLGQIVYNRDYLARLTETYLKVNEINDDIQYAYNSGSEVTQAVYSAATPQNKGYGRYMNYTYDNIGQLTSAQGVDADGVTPRLQEQFGYAYDKAWNLSARTNNALVETFSVNNLNELTTETNEGTLTVAGSAAEWSGNAPYNNYPGVTSVAVNGQTAALYGDGTFAATNFTPVPGNNTYTAVAQDNIGRSSSSSVTVDLAASPSYSYDANGNLLSDGNRNFAYNDENEMTSVWVTNEWRQDFVYDGLMRKRIEKDYSWTGSAWLETNEIRYIYDGYVVVQERNANNLPMVTYTRGIDLSDSLQGAGGIGGLLARTDMGKWIARDPEASDYYFSDAQGNVVGMVDTNGNLVAQYEYDPFGNMIAMSGPMASANKYRFSSKEWDDAAGLYYYGFRFYDPNLQRWPNRDPLSDSGGLIYLAPSVDQEADSGNTGSLDNDELVGLFAQINVNLFGAMANDPMNLWDPLGLKTCSGQARVLKGNKETIGKDGGFSGPGHPVKVAPNSAAVDPDQWGGKAKLRPNLDKISGTFTDTSGKQVGSFSGITDVIGGKHPPGYPNVRAYLKSKNPGKLLVELPSADKDLGTVNVKLTVPDNFPCPQGTQ